jgi:hypothetical protein
VEKLFRCPRSECQRLFLARYLRQDGTAIHFLTECQPHEIKLNSFTETIQKVSPKFCEIYKQASTAEQRSLSLVCGPGYRKALEFLVKDYACKINPTAAERIKATPLGRCITEHIVHPKIVAMASRAAWLGNDETHYLRTWEGKDLEDLKQLINLTIHWIEMEELTKDIVIDMPDKAASAPAAKP